MKKQGFTLIELMVVIVIMGILAAVAVPKLFSMIAKSKASEVGPAAGTYVHMQDTYASEKSDVGTFEEIGYDAPPKNVFEYTGGDGLFNANPVAALDGCDGDWKVESEMKSGKPSHSATQPDCAEKLTPNFTNIGKGS